jgi:ribosomal protein S18 acetylase RimI-like enzyme
VSYQLSFATPLDPAALALLEAATAVPFGHLDMAEWLTFAAWNERGAVVGVLVMEPRNYFDWHLSCAVTDPRFMSRRLLTAIFTATFSRAARITALVEPDNVRALMQVQRLGFRKEGFCRHVIEGTRDAFVFGMLPEECRFLRPQAFVRPPTVTAGATLHG